MEHKHIKDFNKIKLSETNIELTKCAIIDFKTCNLDKYDDIFQKYSKTKNFEVIFEYINDQFDFVSEINNPFELKAKFIAYKNLISSVKKMQNTFRFISSSISQISKKLRTLDMKFTKNFIMTNALMHNIGIKVEQEFFNDSKNIMQQFLNTNYENDLILVSRKKNKHVPSNCESETDPTLIDNFLEKNNKLYVRGIRKKDVKTTYDELFNGDFNDLYMTNIYLLQTGLYINENIKIQFQNLNFILLELSFLFAETNIKNNKGWSENEGIVKIVRKTIINTANTLDLEAIYYLEKSQEIEIWIKKFNIDINNINCVFKKQRDIICDELTNFIEKHSTIYDYYNYNNKHN